MKITHYYIGEPVEGFCKQSAIWVRGARKNSYAPLIYLQRPKWIKDDAIWEKITNSLLLTLPKDFEIPEDNKENQT